MIQFILSLLLTTSALAVPPETILTYKENVFSYYGSHSLVERNEEIEQAIIVVHGSERNADTYYRSFEVLTNKFGKSKSTLIVSTHFKEIQDSLLPNELIFSSEGWLRGDPALNNLTISSFEIMDHFLRLFSDAKNFPKLKKITVTGHSAGGQLVQRYALGTMVDQEFSQIKFKYIVANPGSYVYLTTNRPVPQSLSSTCLYNNYKYGLDNLNPYLKQISNEQKINQYLGRNITYFLGEYDIRSDNIDQECPAVVQGNTRLERGTYYKMQIDQEFPHHRHRLVTVPGVGHTQWGMYTSPQGSQILFIED